MHKYLAELKWPMADQNHIDRGEVSWIELALDFELSTNTYLPSLPTQTPANKKARQARSYIYPGQQGHPDHSKTNAAHRGKMFRQIIKSFEHICGNMHAGEHTNTRTLQTMGHGPGRGLSARPTFNSPLTDKFVMSLADLQDRPK
jgi:hypothetical protein